MLQFMIPCLFGLEGLVGDEVKRLELKNVRVENGHVLCEGEWADLCRLNLNLRCGERVLLLVGKEKAETFDELYEAAARQPWEDFIPKDGQFPVKGYSLNSKLFSLPNCQKIIKKAAAVRLGKVYGMEQLPETGELYQIQFAMRNDIAEFYLDTSGPGLRKRGYRAVSLEAPLRETLAAAMVILSRYRGRDPFCDPFCGSGTIAIEAAMIAKNRAPGLDRRFDSQKWAVLPSKLWLEAADEAMDKEFDGSYEIWGGDIDPRAVALAKDNARKAGVDDVVKFELADATRFHWGGQYGRVVTNPPYGERLMDRSAAEQLYREFGIAMSKLPDTWRISVLSSHTEFERTFGHGIARKRKLYNGMIKCDLFQYGKK